jgi:hypothetical protein
VPARRPSILLQEARGIAHAWRPIRRSAHGCAGTGPSSGRRAPWRRRCSG